MKTGYGAKRFVTLLLSVAMMLSTMNMSLLAVYADDTDGDQAQAQQTAEEQVNVEDPAPADIDDVSDDAVQDEDVPDPAEVEDPANDESGDDADDGGIVEDPAAAEDETGGAEEVTDDSNPYPAFEQSAEVDGVKVTATAAEGAFPEGATLVVRPATAKEEKKADKLVEKVRDTERNIAASYTFDISVVDEDGNELQPANGQTVQLSFKSDEMKEKLLEPEVYHIDESGIRDKAEALDVEVVKEKKEKIAVAETDGFSTYTIVFSYDGINYPMPEDTITLDELMSAVGLHGKVWNVVSSDTTKLQVSGSLQQTGGTDASAISLTALGQIEDSAAVTLTISLYNRPDYRVTVSHTGAATNHDILLLHMDGHEVTADNPMRFSEVVEIYVTGFSSTSQSELGYSYVLSGGDNANYNPKLFKQRSAPSGTGNYQDFTKTKTTNPFEWTFSNTSNGKGWKYLSCQAWAGNTANRPLNIEVTVKNNGGTTVATKTFTGLTVNVCSLEEDVDDVERVLKPIILYQNNSDQSVNLRTSISNAGIAHFTCTASTVTSKLSQEASQHINFNNSTYNATGGAQKGFATATFTISKTSGCNYHTGQSSDIDVDVYVLGQPTAEISGTTLTISNLNPWCTYKVVKVDDDGNTIETVTTENLVPNLVDPNAADKDKEIDPSNPTLSVSNLGTGKYKVIEYININFAEDQGEASANTVAFPNGNEITHTHDYTDFTLSSNGESLVAKCGANNCISADKAPVTLSINKPQNVTYGETLGNASLSNESFASTTGATVSAITYVGTTGAGDDYNSTEKPTAAGTYHAEVTVTKAGVTGSPFTVVSGDFTISKAASSVTAPTAIDGLTFDGSAKTLVNAGSTTDGTIKYRLGTDGEWLDTPPTATNAGSYAVYYYVVGDPNHSDDGSATDPKGPVNVSIGAITVPENDNKLVINVGDAGSYDGNAKEPAVTVSYNGTALTADDFDVAYSNNANAGENTATVTVNLKRNYSGSGTKNFSIAKADLDISVSQDDVTFGDSIEPTVSGTPNSGTSTAFAYKVKDADDSTYTSTAPTAAGDYTVRATVTGSNYNDATATDNFTIGPKSVSGNDISVTLTKSAEEYDGNDKTVTATVKIGDTELEAGTDYEIAVSPTPVQDVNSYTVTITLKGNYSGSTTATYTITPAAASVTTVPAAKKAAGESTLVYDGTNQTLVDAGVASGGEMKYFVSDSDSATPETTASGWKTDVSAVTAKDAGTYYVYYYVDGDNNHSDTAVAGPVAVTIAPKPITVTADNKSSKYGEDLVALTYTVANTLADGDSSNSIKVTLSTAADKDAQAGTEFPITGQADTDSNPNYAVTVTPGTYTITKAQAVVTASSYEGEYDGQPHGITVTVSTGNPAIDLLNKVFGTGKEATVYYSTTAALTSKDGGTTEAPQFTDFTNGPQTVYYFVDLTNYEAGESVSGSATVNITKATQTENDLSNDQKPSAKSSTLTYDGSAQELINAPTTDITGYTVMYSTDGGNTWSPEIPKETNANETGYTVKVRYEAKDDNYTTFDGADIVVPIGKKEVGLTWTNTELTYTGDPLVPTATATGLVGQDSCDVTVDVTGEHTDAGDYTATATALSNSNYKLPQNATQAFKIEAKSAAGELTPEQKASGQLDGALTYNGAAQNLLASAPQMPVGYDHAEYSINGGAFSSDLPTGVDQGEYTIQVKYVPADANHAEFVAADTVTVKIAKKTLTVTWPATTELPYNASDQTYAEAGIVTGIVDNDKDDVTVNISGNTGKAVDNYTAEVSISDGLGSNKADNYQFADGTTTKNWSIIKAAASDANNGNYTAPTAKTGLIYNGKDQALVTAGTVEANEGQMKYYVTTTKLADNADVADVPTADWSDDVPEETNAGTYYVYCYVTEGTSYNQSGLIGPIDVTIGKKDINSTDITASAADSEYTGDPLTPDVTVVFDDGILSPAITLTKDTDFTVTVPEGAGTDVASNIQLTVTGTGNYDGTRTVPWNIIKKPAEGLTGNGVPEGAESLTYNRAAQNLIKDNTGVDPADGTIYYRVKKGSDVVSDWSGTQPTVTDAGEYTVEYYVKGDANHSDNGSEEHPIDSFNVTIAQKALTAVDMTVTFDGIEASTNPEDHKYTYNKNEQGPAVVVKDGETALTQPTEYTLTNATKVNAGEYKVTVAGTGNYTGSVECAYKIEKASSDLNEFDENQKPTANTPGGKNLVYNKTAQDLVNAPSAALPEGYTGVKYSLDGGNTWSELNAIPTGTNAGTYNLKILYVGDSDHNDVDGGTVQVVIDQKPVTVTPTATSKTYGESDPALTYDVADVESGDTVNMTLSREAGDAVGNYNFVITDNDNNYAPVLADGAKFAINAKNAAQDSTLSVTLAQSTYTYNGAECEPGVTVKIGSEPDVKTLVEGTDYDVVYSNNTAAAASTDANAPTVTVNFKGNYSGTTAQTFTIEKAAAAYTAPTVKSGLKYNDSDQKLIDNAGDAKGQGSESTGTLKYLVSTTNTKPAVTDAAWTEDPDAITGEEAGTYYVFYFVDGDKNHEDSAVLGPVTVAIGQKDAPALNDLTDDQKPSVNKEGNKNLVYNDSPQDLVTNPAAAKMPEGYDTVEYKKADGTWTTDIPTGTDAGSYTVTYRFTDSTGNHATTAEGTVTVPIDKLDITNATVTVTPASQTYTGKALTAESIVVKVGNIDVPAADYDVTYSNNTAQGTATVSAVAKAASTNFTGTATGSFTIGATAIASDKITVNFPSGNEAPVYDGTPKTPVPTVTVPDPSDPSKTVTLTAGTDFEVVYPAETTNAGDKTAKIVLKGNYSGDKENLNYTIAKRPLTVTIEDQTVTYGTAIDQSKYSVSGTATNQNATVVLNQSTTDATNGTPGEITATVTVKQGDTDVTSNYAITATPAELTINRASLTPSALTDANKPAPISGGLTYTATDQNLVTPPATADVPEGYKLQYKLSTDGNDKWSDNVPQAKNAGDYTVQYKYVPIDDNHSEVTSDTFTQTVNIGKADLSGNGVVISVSPSSYIFDGTDKEPTVIVTLNGVDLPKSDYEVSYSNNKNKGTATVTVTAKADGNCVNSNSTTFSINAQTVNPDDVTVTFPSASGLEYNGKPQTPDPQVVVGGKTLVKGDDYDVIYPEDSTSAGEKTAKIVFKGDYANAVDGENKPVDITGTYNIAKKAVKITAKDQTISHDDQIAQGVGQVDVTGLLTDPEHTLDSINLAQSVTAEEGNNEGKIGTIEVSKAKIVDAAGTDVTSNYDITYDNTGKLTIKAAQDAPSDADKEDLIKKQETTSITINTQPGYEYVISTSATAPADDADWSTMTGLAGDGVNSYYKEDGNVAGTHEFKPLEVGTVYYVHMRKAAVDPTDDDPSTPADESDPGKDPSPSVTVPTSTKPDTPTDATDGYTVDYPGEALNAKEGYEIFDPKAGDDGKGAWVTKVEDFTPGGDYQVRVAAKDGVAPSEAKDFTAPARPAAPDAVGATDNTANSVTIKDSDAAQEYLVLPAKEGGYTDAEIEKMFKDGKGTDGNGGDLTFTKDSNGDNIGPAADYVIYNRKKAVSEPADKAAIASVTAGPAAAVTKSTTPDAVNDENIDAGTTSITIDPTVKGTEYIVVPKGTDPKNYKWDDAAKSENGEAITIKKDHSGSNLTPGTDYEVVSRVAPTEPGKESEPSAPTSVTTTPDKIDKDSIETTPTTLTIKDPQNSTLYEVTTKGEDGKDEVVATVKVDKDGNVTVEPEGKAEKNDDGDIVVKDLDPDKTYSVTQTKIGEDGKPISEKSEPVSKPTQAATPETPNAVAKSDGSVEIKPTENGTKYIFTDKDGNKTTVEVDKDGNVTVDPASSEVKGKLADDGTLVVSGLPEDATYDVTAVKEPTQAGGADSAPSAPITVKTAKGVPTTPEQDKLVGEAGNDGSIKGVNDTMEYSVDGGQTWTPVPDGKTEITGLSTGDVLVRYEAVEADTQAGTPAQPASDPKTVKVKAKDATAQTAVSAQDIETSATTNSVKFDKPVTDTAEPPTDPAVYEYSIDGGQTWVKTPEFTKDGEGKPLEPGTSYELQVRKAETDKDMPSPATTVTVTTTPESIGNDKIETTPDTLTIKDPQPNTQYEITTKGEDGKDEVVATVTVDEDGNVTVEPEGKAEKNDDGDIVVKDLDPDKTYSVTQAKTDDEGNVISDKSEPVSKPTQAATPETPKAEAKSNGSVEIKPTENGTKYIFKDDKGKETVVEIDKDGKVTVDPEGSNVTGTVTGTGALVVEGLAEDAIYEVTAVKEPTQEGGADSAPSAPITVKTAKGVPTTPEQDKLVGEAGNDGSIKGVDDTMEYSTDGGQTWTPVPDGATEITGLSTGDVLVRYEGVPASGGKPAQPASDPKKVEVKAKDATTQTAVSAQDVETSATTNSVKFDKPVTDTAEPPTDPAVYEYSIDGGKTWVKTPEFTEDGEGKPLEPGTSYELQVRKAETDEDMPSEPTTVTVTTTPESIGSDKIETTPDTLTIKDPQPNTQYEITTKGEDGKDEVVAKVTVDEDGNVTVEPEGKAEKNNDGDIVVKDLDPDKTYSVTQAKTDDEGNVISDKSEPVSKPTQADTPDTPNAEAKSDGSVEIKPTENGTKYIFKDDKGNETVVEIDKDGKVKVDPEGSNITGAVTETGALVVEGLAEDAIYEVTAVKEPTQEGGEESDASAPIKVQTAKGAPTTPEQDKLVGEAGNDGSIKGVDDTMEYSTDGGETWKPVPDGATEITGLGDGEVQVRYEAVPASEGKPAQPASDPVKIEMEKKTEQQAPASPTVKSDDPNSITIKDAQPGTEYEVKDGDGNTVAKVTVDKDGNVTSEPADAAKKNDDGSITVGGLEPATSYEITAKKTETDGQNASEPSEPVKVSTAPATPDETVGETNAIKVEDSDEDLEYIVVPKGTDPEDYDWSNAQTGNGKELVISKDANGNDMVPGEEYEVVKRTPAVKDETGKEITPPSAPSEPTPAYTKTEAPEEDGHNARNITVEANPGQEYVIVPEGKTPETMTEDDWANAVTAKEGENTVTISGLEADKEYQIVTRKVGIKETTSQPITVKTKESGQYKATVDSKDSDVEAEVSGLDSKLTEELCTAAEKENVLDGTNAELVLKMNKVEESKVASGDKAAAEKAAAAKDGDAKVGSYIDLSLTKEFDDGTSEKVTDTNGNKVQLSVKVPAELKNTDKDVERTFYVISIVDGKATVIAETTSDKLDFETDKFSTYAIAYKDKALKESVSMTMDAGLKVQQKGDSVTISWKKADGVDQYRIYGAYCGSKLKLQKKVGSGTYKLKLKKINGKKINQKKNYKFYVAAYEKINGKYKRVGRTICVHIVGSKSKKFTNAKGIKVKKTKVTLGKGKTHKITPKIVKVYKNKKELGSGHGPKFRYATSDPKVATVSKKGVIKAKGPGKCNVYVYAINGYAKKIKVTVK